MICSVCLPIAAFSQKDDQGGDDQKVKKLFDSPNVTELLNNLPYEADHPIVKDIRFIYASVLELKKKKFEPYLVTNEDEKYFKLTKKGVSGLELNGQYDAFQKQGRDWIKKNDEKNDFCR